LRTTQYISRRVVLRRWGVRGELLDRLEELQLLAPVQRRGRGRAYHVRDLDRLRVYRILLDELGVNDAGAEIILRLRERLLGLQRRLTLLVQRIQTPGVLEELRGILGSLEDDNL
jgi:MerR family transcriptional regulator/heat shock protein HspR